MNLHKMIVPAIMHKQIQFCSNQAALDLFAVLSLS